MSANQNRQAMQRVWSALAEGDRRPFRDLMADDFVWRIAGRSRWSRAFHGRERVAKELFEPLFAQFQGKYVSRPQRFIADGDLVVVECEGDVELRRGGRYRNVYCLVCRLVDGRLVELTEYMDTALAEQLLEPLADSAGRQAVEGAAQ